MLSTPYGGGCTQPDVEAVAGTINADKTSPISGQLLSKARCLYALLSKRLHELTDAIEEAEFSGGQADAETAEKKTLSKRQTAIAASVERVYWLTEQCSQ